MVEEKTKSLVVSGGESLDLTDRYTLFIGRGTYAIDDKGRLTLPAHMRAPLSDGGVLSPMDGRAAIWAKQTFSQAVAELRQKVVTGELSLDIVNGFVHSANPIRPDAQGRIVIPTGVRLECGLERDVVVLGSGPRIEIVALDPDDIDGLKPVDSDVVDALAWGGF